MATNEMATNDIAPPQAHTGGPGTRAGDHSRRHLYRHYAEMLLAMFAGMAVLGAAAQGVVAVAGWELPARSPELMSLEMALSMAVGMVVWMRHRGHGWPGTLEMAGAMVASAVALWPLLWLGVITGGWLLTLEHLLMLPLMYLLMRRRRSEYAA